MEAQQAHLHSEKVCIDIHGKMTRATPETWSLAFSVDCFDRENKVPICISASFIFSMECHTKTSILFSFLPASRYFMHCINIIYQISNSANSVETCCLANALCSAVCWQGHTDARNCKWSFARYMSVALNIEGHVLTGKSEQAINVLISFISHHGSTPTRPQSSLRETKNIIY